MRRISRHKSEVRTRHGQNGALDDIVREVAYTTGPTNGYVELFASSQSLVVHEPKNEFCEHSDRNGHCEPTNR